MTNEMKQLLAEKTIHDIVERAISEHRNDEDTAYNAALDEVSRELGEAWWNKLREKGALIPYIEDVIDRDALEEVVRNAADDIVMNIFYDIWEV